MNTPENQRQELPDLLGQPDIVKLVDAFYGKVRADAPLGHVFDGVAKVNWETHLPKLYAFWDTVLFRAGTFRGNPMAAHLKLVEQTDMGWPLFERWLELFRETVNENFAGENAGHIIRCAEDMARVIHSKIHAIPDSRLDPARLTPEQKARYASYREAPVRG
ncbi:MAG: group III truncated hemoglobin [Verrucomicrobiota bacterium]